ncbi:MAG: cell division protein FtsA [Candidatus Pacebacteria bacterium]|nr:cell division protein FtsA [Candidatus Paceibacterota bacterium]MDD4074022.1 cell division protein FtsA [Candidatus Paceibacterota bacterium]
MAKAKATIGIDIGTHKIKVLGINRETSEALFLEIRDSYGVQKGRIKEPSEVSQIIGEILESIERKHNYPIENVFVNINGTKLELIPSQASISVGRADQKVSEEDVERVKEEVKMINLQSGNKKILDVLPKDWILDNDTEARNPVGMQGFKLELKAMLLSVFNADIESIIEALEGIDITEENIVPSPIADADAILNPSQKELGVALINIGAGTTSVSIYEEGKLLSMTVFPIGSGNITNDIAIGFKTEIEVAEKIKKQYGSCIKKKASKKINFSLDDDEDDDEDDEPKKSKNILTFSEKDLIKIIEARVCEIFELANQEIKKLSKQGLLPAGIIITGGGANLSGIVELAKNEFKLPAKIGYCKEIKGLDKDSSLSTVCGTLLSQADKKSFYTPENKFLKKIKKIINNFIP